MGQQIIRQPNGMFCVFSTSIDELIVTDATADEVIERFAQMAAQEATERVTRLIEQVLDPQARPYYQFTITYDEAVAHDAETKAFCERSSIEDEPDE